MRLISLNRAAKIALSITSVFVFLILVFRANLAMAADEGEATYKAKCQMCHGPDGTSNTPTGKSMKASDLTAADTQKKSDEDLKETISKGKNKMPSFAKTLKEDQIGQLVAHLRTFKKK